MIGPIFCSSPPHPRTSPLYQISPIRNKYRVADMEDEVMDERSASQVIRSCSQAKRKQVEEGVGSGVANVEDGVMDGRDVIEVIRSCSQAKQKQDEDGAGSGVANVEDEVMDGQDASEVIRSCSQGKRKKVEDGAGSGDLPKMSCRPGETDKSDYYRKCEEEFAEAIRRSKIPVPISEALMEFFGIKENRMLEQKAMVGVWDYIVDNGLVATDENGDEEIGTVYCDEKLKKLFKVDTFHGFELSLHIIKHLLKRALED